MTCYPKLTSNGLEHPERILVRQVPLLQSRRAREELMLVTLTLILLRITTCRSKCRGQRLQNADRIV